MNLQTQSNRLITYFHDSYVELKRVVWPNRKQAIQHSVMVVILSIVVALFLAGLDIIFSQGMDRLLQVSI
ncbi:preprotein translocase subunit SecE [Candidatus Uhrbacteria bacterium]|nr:preprotein translocase subunit SecE [Candidatus Uhrbacteria bacterium]